METPEDCRRTLYGTVWQCFIVNAAGAGHLDFGLLGYGQLLADGEAGEVEDTGEGRKAVIHRVSGYLRLGV